MSTPTASPAVSRDEDRRRRTARRPGARRSLAALAVALGLLAGCATPESGPIWETGLLSPGSGFEHNVTNADGHWSFKIEADRTTLVLREVTVVLLGFGTDSGLHYAYEQVDAPNLHLTLRAGPEAFWTGDEVRIGEQVFDLDEAGTWMLDLNGRVVGSARR